MLASQGDRTREIAFDLGNVVEFHSRQAKYTIATNQTGILWGEWQKQTHILYYST
jgi:hypothetical protein